MALTTSAMAFKIIQKCNEIPTRYAHVTKCVSDNSSESHYVTVLDINFITSVTKHHHHNNNNKTVPLWS